MTNDLDIRIATLEAKRRTDSLATVRDAEQVVGELNEAVRQASITVGGLNARTDLIDERASSLERRIRQIWVLVGAGVVVSVVAAAFVVALRSGLRQRSKLLPRLKLPFFVKQFLPKLRHHVWTVKWRCLNWKAMCCVRVN